MQLKIASWFLLTWSVINLPVSRFVGIVPPRTLWLWSRPVRLHSGQADWWCRLGVEERTHPHLIHRAKGRPHHGTRWAPPASTLLHTFQCKKYTDKLARSKTELHKNCHSCNYTSPVTSDWQDTICTWRRLPCCLVRVSGCCPTHCGASGGLSVWSSFTTCTAQARDSSRFTSARTGRTRCCGNGAASRASPGWGPQWNTSVTGNIRQECKNMSLDLYLSSVCWPWQEDNHGNWLIHFLKPFVNNSLCKAAAYDHFHNSCVTNHTLFRFTLSMCCRCF